MKKEDNNPKTINCDQPLKTINDDKLGNSFFAKKIVELIVNYNSDNGFSIGITGPWGIGKSTILNFIDEYIRDDINFFVIKFNPWWFSDQGDLLFQFLRTIGKSLKLRNSSKSLKRIGKLLIATSNLFSPLEYIPSVGIFAKLAQKPLKYIGDLLTSKAENRSTDLEKQKKLICEGLLKQDKKIIVLIDDIDRLPEYQIKQMFMVIKAIADFPRMIYIMAFDEEAVARVLSYGNSSSSLDSNKSMIDLESGKQYLEKIIQVQLNVPKPDKKAINDMLLRGIGEISDNTPDNCFDKDEFRNIYLGNIEFIFQSPRDVIRYLNSFSIFYRSLIGEVNLTDFVAIEVLRLFLPTLYDYIRNNPLLFTGLQTRDLEIYRETYNEYLSVLNSYPKDLSKIGEETCRRLFPKIDRLAGGLGLGNGFYKTYRNNLKICIKENFDIYFRYSYLEGEMSNTQFTDIIYNIKEQRRFENALLSLSKKIARDGRSSLLKVFLEKFEYCDANKINENSKIIAIRSFLNIGDNLLLDIDEKEFFSIGSEFTISRIVMNLLQFIPSEEKRCEVIKEAIKDSNTISVVVFITQTIEMVDNKSHSQDTSQEQQFSAESIKSIIGDTCNKIQSFAADYRLLESRSFLNIVFRWKDWAGMDKVIDFVNEVKKDDLRFIKLLSRFVKPYKTMGMTSSPSQLPIKLSFVNYDMDIQSLDKLVNLDETIIQIETILKNRPDLSTEQIDICHKFIEEVRKYQKKETNENNND